MRIFFSALLSVTMLAAMARGANSNELDDMLRGWIESNVAFETTSDNRTVFLMRKQPVRAYIRIDDDKLAAEARSAIANLAQAFNLSFEFTSNEVNLIIASAPQISDGKRPSASLLRSFGLSDNDVNYIATDLDWSVGCGMYGSREPNRRDLTYGIGAVSKQLPEERMRSCLITTIVMAFGMRPQIADLINYKSGYLQFLLLGRGMRDCDSESQAKATADDLKECLFKKLKAKLDLGGTRT